MNNAIFEGKWDVVKGQIKQTWGKLTDNDMKMLEGNQQKIYGKLQEYYGYSQEEAQKQVKEFRNKFH